MKIEDIEIHEGEIDRDYTVISQVSAKITNVGLAAFWTPKIEDVNSKLREKAVGLGANAVIKVKYDRGMIMKSLSAEGVAVKIVSDEIDCPFCAEKIKKKAIKCKHCGSDLNNAPKKGKKPKKG